VDNSGQAVIEPGCINNLLIYNSYMTHKIICISGKVASGKTTLSKKISEIIGCNHFSVSDYLKSIAKMQRNDIIDRPLLQKLGEECINKGWDKFANDFLSFINYKNKKYIIIDGIRHVEFYKSLYQISSKLSVLIYIEINDKVLLNRLLLRGEENIDYSHIAEGNLSNIKDISDYILNADDKDVEVLAKELLEKLNLDVHALGNDE
jgi:adenylate kinase family enzyme